MTEAVVTVLGAALAGALAWIAWLLWREREPAREDAALRKALEQPERYHERLSAQEKERAERAALRERLGKGKGAGLVLLLLLPAAAAAQRPECTTTWDAATGTLLTTCSGLPTPAPPPSPCPSPSPTEPPPSPPPPPPPPSGQVGYGAKVTGGAGGRVITLGPSSTEADVRAALTATGPRQVVTAAGMLPPVWMLAAETIVNTGSRGDLTIDCSPSKGCTIVKRPNIGATTYEGVRFANGVGNILIRKVRFVGEYVPETLPTPHINNSSALEFDGDGPPSAAIRGVYLDHVVVSNATDSGPDFYGEVSDVTCDGCFLYDSLHPMTISGSNEKTKRERFTIYRGLFAYNGERSPQLRRPTYDVDYANNVVYSWCATDYPVGDPGGYGMKIEDEAGIGFNPDRVLIRGNAFLPGPCSVVRNKDGSIAVNHQAWDLIYGTRAGCDTGGAPADPHVCNPRLSVGALRVEDNIFSPQHSKYDAFTTRAGADLAPPPYSLAVASSRDLEAVILGAGIPEADTPREAEVRAAALAAYQRRKAGLQGADRERGLQ